jgi:hypothetical protein
MMLSMSASGQFDAARQHPTWAQSSRLFSKPVPRVRPLIVLCGRNRVAVASGR